ncbi:MAG: hypothetical protein HEQ24_10630 [Dolichospermum sp. BR01]|nr:hypothetical protein [Dolichospermum sp. BR01]
MYKIYFFNEGAIAPLNSQTAIAPLQLPKQRSHPLNSQTAIALPPTFQTAITPPQLPNSDRTLQLPNSDS